MSNSKKLWQDLIPSNLPSKYLKVWFGDYNPRQSLAAFDFAGFVYVDERTAPKSPVKSGETALYYSPNCVANMAIGKNHYGSLYAIEISPTSIEIIDYCMGHDGEACHQTAMRLLEYLVVDLRLACHWHAWAEYWDSGEHSDITKGTEKELQGLFARAEQNEEI